MGNHEINPLARKPSALDMISQEGKTREFQAKRRALHALQTKHIAPRNPNGSPTDTLRGYIEFFSNEILLEELQKRRKKD